jgi:Tol biopolymer transport system component
MTGPAGLRVSGDASAGREVALVSGASVLVALLALVLAPLGSTALYGIAGLVGIGVFLWVVRGEVLPPLRDAVDRIRPRAVRGGRVPSRTAGLLSVAVAAVGVALAALFLAPRGLVALAAVGGLLAVTCLVWLCWPLLVDLLTRPPEDVPDRRRAPAAVRVPRPATSAHRRAAVYATVIVFIGPVAFVLAGLGLTALIAIVGAVVLGVLIAVVRDRSVCFTFLTVASLVVVLHKSLGPQDLGLSSGAVSVYVTTFDLLVLLLYGFWAREGTLVTDVRAALRRPFILVPLVGAVLLLPSVLVAPSDWHAASELVRMAWMYLLFFYVAVRVRTRRHVWALLAGLAVFASVECLVIMGQWATGGNLGLSFLGVPTGLTQRISDVGSIGRPFGTIIHPVFMGAVMGSLTLLALSLAIHLPRSLTKIAAIVAVPVCALPLYLAHARAAVLAVVLAALYVMGTGLARGHLRWATVGRFALGGLVVGLAFLPQLSAKFSENFFTGHFWQELESRLQLNGIAMEMWDDHWVLGVGLNNFEIVLPRYESYFVIFFGNPVHNLYLLYLSETGIIGLAGVLLVGFAMFRAAVLAARSSDRLLGGIGVGIVGVMVFLALEEMLGFSLRQDVPLALYWLLAGLALACLQLSPAQPPPGRAAGRYRPRPRSPQGRPPVVRPRVRSVVPTPRPPVEAQPGALHSRSRAYGAAVRSLRGRRAPRARHRAAATWPRAPRLGFVPRLRLVALLAVGALALAALPATGESRAADAAPGGLLFEATVRATGHSAIFSAALDGTGIRQLTPDDGRDYSWPRWAYGNRKVVYTVRSETTKETATAIALMNADGSEPQVISSFDYAVGQPRIDATGSWMVFTARPPWYPTNGIFRMDLETLESVNLSGRTNPRGALDADPELSPDERWMVFIAGATDRADVVRMSVDGSDRRAVTHDLAWNTDPAISPDGASVAISSYRGEGTPKLEGLQAKPYDFHLTRFDLATGTERVLTQGLDCSSRLTSDPCSVDEMSAYAPRYLGNEEIGFVGALDRRTTCICAIGADGSDPHPVISSEALAINWFDVARDGEAAANWSDIGSHRPGSRLLVTMASGDGSETSLVDASTDLMHRTELALPGNLRPGQARWSPDRSRIVFTAAVPVPASPSAPHPPAPPGEQRREHFTLSDLQPLSIALRAQQADAVDPRNQVFLRSGDGSVRALTDPWIEDWRDGLVNGDARSNSDPVFTPDGRAVLVTNTSSVSGESFLLRIDLATGEVLNLTNATSGAVPVDDGAPTVAPHGGRVAFTWSNGTAPDVYTMNGDGSDVRPVAATAAHRDDPVWLPDGRAIVSVTRGSAGAALVRTDVGTGDTTVLAEDRRGPASRPVPDPAGDRVAFLGQLLVNSTAFRVPLDGGVPAPVQPDPLHQYLDLDWR